jgi:two-component system OmpR family sensor kinase
VTNLLENAARHSPPGRPVEVGLTATGRLVRLQVADHGPGVAAEDAETVFEPFHSGTLAGSSGLGLAICKAVVEAHGGTIALRGFPGFGAVFCVTLPRR